MLGAIIGDIVGSRFEFNNHKSKDFELFTDDCFFTDDTVMTLAVAKAIMDTERIVKPSLNNNNYEHYILERMAFKAMMETGEKIELNSPPDYYTTLTNMAIKYMQEIGRRCPDCGYGNMFREWVFSDNPEPYNSYGNGAAMRISPVGFSAVTEEQARQLSEMVTSITHDHEEGIKGAEATTMAIHMARRGYLKEDIRRIISNEYDLNFTLDMIRDTYQFNETCQETIPQAIVAFLESTSFEDAIRNAISIGGDSDTLAAITGAIAEAYYGIPKEIKDKALTYLDEYLLNIYNEWCNSIEEKATENFRFLTKYIGILEQNKSYGEWDKNFENYKLPKELISTVGLNHIIDSFIKEFQQFSDSHSEYELNQYSDIPKRNTLAWKKPMSYSEIESMDAQCVLNLIMDTVSANQLWDGALISFTKDGYLLKCLKRLKDIDLINISRIIEELSFTIGGHFAGYKTYHMIFENNSASLKISSLYHNKSTCRTLSPEETQKFIDTFRALHTEYWVNEFQVRPDMGVLDGTQWGLSVKYKGQRGTEWSGNNAYPKNWNELFALFSENNDD